MRFVYNSKKNIIMKIYSVQNNISYQPKFAQKPVVQNTLKLVKKSNDAAGISLSGGLLEGGKKIIKQTQDLLIKARANMILENHPKREEILNILQENDEESQNAKLEFLELIKNITLSEDKLDYLLRLLKSKFPKEPIIAKVWGLCMQNGLDIYTLQDITYRIDAKSAKNIFDKNLIDKYKDSPEQALLMGRFDSDETMDKVSKYAETIHETARARKILKLPAHDDILTNSVLDLISRFKNLVHENNTNKTYTVGYDLDMISYWKGSFFTLEDIISKNKILDIIEKKTDLGSSLYYVTDILNRTEKITETIIADILQREDISVKTANKLILLMNNDKNTDFIHSLCCDKSLKIKPEKISQYIRTFDLLCWTSLDSDKLKLPDKINLLQELQSIPEEMKLIYAKYGYDIDYYINMLNKMLGEKVPVVIVPKNIQQDFISAFLANNNPEAENILKTHDFTQYGKEGIPLKYSRKDFCKNINSIISTLEEDEQSLLLKHFGLTRGQNYSDGTVSFDGILNNRKFGVNKVREEVKNAANGISEEIEKFTVKNETLFEDIELKKFFDNIIKGFPEFTAVVGKEQHSTHAYSVDIHTLKVLQSSMNNPLYSTLSDKEKTILKMSVLLHDIGKPCGRRDEGHANTSANYAEGILEKINFSEDVKGRIIDIIQNHHWFGEYNKGFLPIEDVVVRCRRPGDFKIYQIMAKADLENVNKYFHLGDKSGGAKTQAEFDKYIEEKMKPIDQVLNQLYTRHNSVFYTRFTGNGKLFPIQKVKIDNEEVELRVLDLNKLADNTSLEQYGFPPGTTKENVRFLVHMTRPNIINLESVIHLTKNHLNHNTWSASIIKPSKNITYENYDYGFALNAEQANFAEAYFENIASGNNKTLESFRDSLFGKILHYDTRKLGVDLTQEERQQLNTIIMKKGYLKNINEDIVLGDKTINQKQAYEACGGDSWLYLRDIMLENLKQEGFNLNENEYADLTKYLMTKKYLTQITKPNRKGELTGQPVKIGKHLIPAVTLVDCLKRTLERLFGGGHIQSEVITFDPVPSALLAKVKCLEQCHHDFLVTAKKYRDTIPIIIQENRS